MISQTVLELLSGNENPRWLPGGHIGFPIGPKIEVDLYLIMIHLHTENHFNISNGSRVIQRKWNPRWLPGGYIVYLIIFNVEVDLSLVHTNKPAKFQINQSNDSQDVERKWKSKMAAWWPYWISDRLQNRTWPVSYNETATYQNTFQYLKRFLRYWVCLIWTRVGNTGVEFANQTPSVATRHNTGLPPAWVGSATRVDAVSMVSSNHLSRRFDVMEPDFVFAVLFITVFDHCAHV